MWRILRGGWLVIVVVVVAVVVVVVLVLLLVAMAWLIYGVLINGHRRMEMHV